MKSMHASTKLSDQAVGIGLRRGMMDTLDDLLPEDADFMELAPENWIGVGGRLGKRLRSFTERYTFFAHGLSLSLGGPAPLDVEFLQQVREFLDEHNIAVYSEHLSFCSDEKGHLYDLMPIPFTQEAVDHVVRRIDQVQEATQRRLVIEHVSYYAAPGQEMLEVEFINSVLANADCELLLDVNNIIVNSINHGYDAEAFLRALDGERTRYIHLAGHFEEADDLRIDTHGSAVADSVWQLLDQAYALYGSKATLLERDFNFPPLPELQRELSMIRKAQSRAGSQA